MKTPAKLAIALVVIAIAYPATTWYTGNRVESIFAEQYAKLEKLPYVQVVEHHYEKRFFDATDTATFSVPLYNLTLKVRTTIKHGPLTGWFAAATSDSEVTTLDDKKLLEVHSSHSYGGGGHSTVASQEIGFEQAQAAGGSTRFALNGLAFEIDYSANMERLKSKGTLSGISIEDEKVKMEFKDWTFKSDQKQIYADIPVLLGGAQSGNISEINITPKTNSSATPPPITLRKLAYDSKDQVNGDFIDLFIRSGAEQAQLQGQDYGPANIDVSFRHLHGRTLATLYQNLVSLTPNTNPQEALAKFEPAQELLQHNPEFHLDRVSFTTPEGESQLAGHITIKDFGPEDIKKLPYSLSAKLDASGEASVPVAFLARVGAEAQAKSLLQAGYANEENGVLKTSASVQKGEITVNGKPFGAH
jgi:uncharacterized protein YdgA (DUF945 family)